MKAIVSLSGGMDSAVALGLAIWKYGAKEVSCVSFDYGSKHSEYEQRAACNVARHYEVELTHVDLREISKHLQSNLLLSGGDIPEGHYNDDSMSQTVVPGRNMIFASVLAGIAWTRNAPEVWLGIHLGDRTIYPDCRQEFFEAMRAAVEEGTGYKVSLVAPFLQTNKAGIVKQGIGLHVPFHLTRTCYANNPVACGRCGSCCERLESFQMNNIPDPVEYQK